MKGKDNTPDKPYSNNLVFFHEFAYRKAYPEYSDIRVIAVKDEDKYMENPNVAALLKDGYKVLTMDAFGSGFNRDGTMVILAKD